jgi:hypothetical protein
MGGGKSATKALTGFLYRGHGTELQQCKGVDDGKNPFGWWSGGGLLLCTVLGTAEYFFKILRYAWDRAWKMPDAGFGRGFSFVPCMDTLAGVLTRKTHG